MSISIQPGVSLQSLQLGQGIALRAAQISDCTPLLRTPAGVTIPVDWSKYGASSLSPVLINVDLTTLGPANGLEAIRSIYIDNTFSVQGVYVFFPDTGYTIVCPANSVCLWPVWTNGLVAQIYSIGFNDTAITKTTFTFSNLHVAAGSISNATSIITAPTLFRTTHRANPTGTATKTFTLVDFGVFLSAGIQYIVTHSSNASGNNPTVTALTADAIAGTSIIQLALTGAAPLGISTSIWRVNTNLSGQLKTVVVTHGSTQDFCAIDVISTNNLTNSAAKDTKSATSPAAMALVTGALGVAIASSCTETGLANANLIGIKNVVSYNDGGALQDATGIQQTDGSTLTITSGNAGATTANVAASFV
jgi:hypothetical protein